MGEEEAEPLLCAFMSKARGFSWEVGESSAPGCFCLQPRTYEGMGVHRTVGNTSSLSPSLQFSMVLSRCATV